MTGLPHGPHPAGGMVSDPGDRVTSAPYPSAHRDGLTRSSRPRPPRPHRADSVPRVVHCPRTIHRPWEDEIMSTYVLHIGRNGGAYGVRERTEDLLIWQAEDAGASSAAYLVAFLNAHARHLGAHQARRAARRVRFDAAARAGPTTNSPSTRATTTSGRADHGRVAGLVDGPGRIRPGPAPHERRSTPDRRQRTAHRRQHRATGGRPRWPGGWPAPARRPRSGWPITTGRPRSGAARAPARSAARAPPAAARGSRASRSGAAAGRPGRCPTPTRPTSGPTEPSGAVTVGTGSRPHRVA